ncbi:hypothetical protein K438DRAFT_1785697 [Mycena galopus ATCC 62051]|nr:hypothetical protein K438DRAFT_1785697 [Mycena galopus ATCC 62051]
MFAETFGLLDGKWKDFVADRCSFSQRMMAGLNFALVHLPVLSEAYNSAYETRKPLQDNWIDSWERFYAYVLYDCMQTMFFSRWMRGHSPQAVGLMNKLAGQLAQAPLENATAFGRVSCCQTHVPSTQALGIRRQVPATPVEIYAATTIAGACGHEPWTEVKFRMSTSRSSLGTSILNLRNVLVAAERIHTQGEIFRLIAMLQDDRPA